MTQLETRFVDAVEHLELPDIDLVTAVLERIGPPETVAPPGAAPDRRRRSFSAAAVMAVLLLAVAAILAFTPAGQAVADWLGLGSTGVEIIDDNSDSGDAGLASSDSSSLGQPVVDSTADPMPSLGSPDSVFDDSRRGRSFLWESANGSGVLLSVRSTDSPLAIKSVVGIEGVEFLTIDAGGSDDTADELPALWIGDPHNLRYPADAVDLGLAETLTSGPVVIWLDGDVEYRLEGPDDQTTATDLAEEVMAAVEEGTELLGPG